MYRQALFIVSLFFTGALMGCFSETKGSDTCGDNVIDPGEECDGYDLGGLFCQGLGYYGGAIACRDDCTLELGTCVPYGRCGDGNIQPLNESCDGNAMTDSGCDSIGYAGGTLSCTEACRYDLTDCEGANVCGNGVVNAPEECDGEALSGKSCTDFADFQGGELRCGSDCRFDFSQCYSQVVCGDGKVQGNELCDGANLNHLTCEDFGFSGGTLRCDDCHLSAVECEGEIRCGDGARNGVEECDGTDFGGETCASRGFYDGTLVCRPDCTIDEQICEYFGRCGDGVINGGEPCDGADLGSATCTTFGLNGGTLKCLGNCELDVTACGTLGSCGDGAINGDEECDGTLLGGATCESIGYHGTGLGCGADCRFDVLACSGRCGDGIVQSAYEQCDGSVEGVTCEQYGYLSGAVPVCWDDCTAELSQCNSVELFGTVSGTVGTSMVVGSDGAVYLAGSTPVDPWPAEDYFFAVFSPATRTWISWQDGVASFENARGMVPSAGGEFVIAGVTDGTMGATAFGGTDIFVAFHQADGSLSSRIQIGGAGDDEVKALAQGADGSLYLTGSTTSALAGGAVPASSDAFVMKLDASGTMLWVRQFDSLESMEDGFNAIAVDTAGNLWVSGYSSGTFGGQSNQGGTDAVLAKLTADGTMIWTRSAASAGNDTGMSVAVAPSGNVFITGTTDGTLDGESSRGGEDVLVAGFTTDGTPLFAHQLGSTAGDSGATILWVSSGHLIVVGTTGGSFEGAVAAGWDDIVSFALAEDGTVSDVRQYGESQIDTVHGAMVGPNGAVYVTGTTSSNLGPWTNPTYGSVAFVYTIVNP